ncbi:hypothetical protein LIER_06830 [Lithospermum erythrorhizon]|uniref:RecQ-mediated genome instability protein 2 n=1 Tax=Lithospermum erythrorhizon TaxID=34254 RepID=A0AAV3P5T7_LITER
MDYSLGAVKLTCAQLKSVRQISHSQNSYTLGTLLFQRAWLQGILVSTPASAVGGRFLLDDGTGLIELAGEVQNRPLDIGAYLMVVGVYVARENDLPIIKVHKIVDLSMHPYREAMWYLEVIEAFKLFYQPVVNTGKEKHAHIW